MSKPEGGWFLVFYLTLWLIYYGNLSGSFLSKRSWIHHEREDEFPRLNESNQRVKGPTWFCCVSCCLWIAPFIHGSLYTPCHWSGHLGMPPNSSPSGRTHGTTTTSAKVRDVPGNENLRTHMATWGKHILSCAHVGFPHASFTSIFRKLQEWTVAKLQVFRKVTAISVFWSAVMWCRHGCSGDSREWERYFTWALFETTYQGGWNKQCHFGNIIMHHYARSIIKAFPLEELFFVLGDGTTTDFEHCAMALSCNSFQMDSFDSCRMTFCSVVAEARPAAHPTAAGAVGACDTVRYQVKSWVETLVASGEVQVFFGRTLPVLLGGHGQTFKSKENKARGHTGSHGKGVWRHAASPKVNHVI